MQKKTILVLSGYKNKPLITEDSAVLILLKDSKSKLKSGCYATGLRVRLEYNVGSVFKIMTDTVQN